MWSYNKGMKYRTKIVLETDHEMILNAYRKRQRNMPSTGSRMTVNQIHLYLPIDVEGALVVPSSSESANLLGTQSVLCGLSRLTTRIMG